MMKLKAGFRVTWGCAFWFWASIIGGFPKIRGPFLGGSYNKDYSMIVSLGLLGSPYFGKLQQSAELL